MGADMTDRFADRFADLMLSLRQRYDAEGRTYHNWSHIQALLTQFERLTNAFHDPAAVEIALYYHDVIYAPGSTTNESDSADVMAQELTGRADANEIASATLIVNATAAHAVPAGTAPQLAQDCAMFLDMDLAILGADAEAFDSYDRNIRQEFAMVPDAMFYPARLKVMQGFLDRERIYLTERFHVSHDTKARSNLRRLIERLS